MARLVNYGDSGGRAATPLARRLRRGLFLACAGAACAALAAPLSGQAPGPGPQLAFSRAAINARVPIVREERYLVNARVRPLLLFWIGRDDIGGARLTWRAGADGRRGFEFLIGSDPARTPKQVNRWGFIVEEVNAGGGEVLGLMKESGERSLEEAKANVDQALEEERSTFKSVRTTIDGKRASSGTVSFDAPSNLTYKDLEALLGLMPSEPRVHHTTELPAGTQLGFLMAMTSVIRDSIEPCRGRTGATAGPVRQVPYLYNHTIFDLFLVSCDYVPVLHTKRADFPDVINGRFQVRNRRTGDMTKFQVAYGASRDLRGIPVRAEFRPRWWMEVELLLAREADPAQPPAQP